MVDLDKAAWHAGASEMPYKGEMTSSANRFTIGIELANCGYLVVDNLDSPNYFKCIIGKTLYKYKGEQPIRARLHYYNGLVVDGWWEPYSDVQLDALQALLCKLKLLGYQQAVENLIGHDEIAMPLGRKKDVGPLFPWKRFSRKLPLRVVSELY